jgi:hypothetical protein
MNDGAIEAATITMPARSSCLYLHPPMQLANILLLLAVALVGRSVDESS